MADWLLIIPGEGETIRHPDRNKLASALRCPNPEHVKITEVAGAYFYSVAETADDPGVVIVTRDDGQKCAVVASALLTERDDFIREIRTCGRNVTIESSDGELLAHAVSIWGNKTWEKPGGEFSVASWMPEKKSLLMATDGEGQRPAFWSQIKKGFVASTRFEAMMLVPMIPKEPNKNQLILVLAGIRSLPESEDTWLKNVSELRPGFSLYFRDDIIKKQKWWYFPSDIPIWRPKNSEEAIERYRHTLFNSVKDRIRGQNKVAIALTGGMDSTPVAATLVKIHEKFPHFKMKAFHAEYPAELNSQEAELTKEVADTLGLKLVKVPIGEFPVWPLMQKTHSWPPHHWYGHIEPFTKILSEYSTSVLVGARGELFSRATFLDSLERGRIFNTFSALIRMQSLGYNLKPYKRMLWLRRTKIYKSLNNEKILPWIRLERSGEHILHHLNTLANWEPTDTPKRLTYLHVFTILQRGMSHLYDYENRRVAMLDPYSCREILKLATSIEPVPWRIEKYLPRLSFESILPHSVISRRRIATPWLFYKFFESNSTHNHMNETLHPIIHEIIDSEKWQSYVKNDNTYNSAIGHTWLKPLILNSWLNKI